MDNVGIITEQGDLGLGFKELSEKDKRELKKKLIKETEENEIGAE